MNNIMNNIYKKFDCNFLNFKRSQGGSPLSVLRFIDTFVKLQKHYNCFSGIILYDSGEKIDYNYLKSLTDNDIDIILEIQNYYNWQIIKKN